MSRSNPALRVKHTISHRSAGKKKGKAEGLVRKREHLYKKSVSSSLVYRSLKVDKDGYIGFKVTYSGKGRKGNYDLSRLSIILIPEISVVRSYRPIAGAIARATKGEVYTCCYTQFGQRNESVMSCILERVTHLKSKVRRIDVISQSSEVLEVFRERLSRMNHMCDARAEGANSIETPDQETISVQVSDHTSAPKSVTRAYSSKPRVVHLIKINSRAGTKRNENMLSSVFKTLLSKLVTIFGKGEEVDDLNKGSNDETSLFKILDQSYCINEKLNFSNPFHCDIIAKDMLGLQQTP